MRKFTPGRLAGAVVAVLATLVLVSFSSSATAVVPYCGVPVPAKTTCPYNTGGHLIESNEARYSGAGDISVCQKVTRGGTVYDRSCGTDHAYLGGALSYGYYIGWVGNDSPWEHTIEGYFSALDVAGRAASVPTNEAAATSAPASARDDLAVLTKGVLNEATTIVRPNDAVSLKTTRDRLCLESTQAGSGSCQAYDKLDEAGLLFVGICSPRLPADKVGVYGVVVDGSRTVNAVATDGSNIASAVVASNTFALPLTKADAANTDHFESVNADGSTRSLGNVLPEDLGC